MVTKKQYVKPVVEKVSLVPNEAVLGGCKTLSTGSAEYEALDGCAAASCVTDANS